jgi:hypothetical protein
MIPHLRLDRRQRVGRLAAAAGGLWLSVAVSPAVAEGSALAELFPAGLPAPFAAVLDRLREEAGAEHVQTVLVPLGRSLQRYAAHPDYFASPRIVVAVTGDRAAGPGAPRLADRLFLGYAPAAAVVEAISYDEAAGRFVFEEVVGYGADGAAIEPADRGVCLRCHQGEGPIFARPLWSETNADPDVAARLAPLGASFHGAPVAQTVDGLAAFDAATDRAAEAAAAGRLWAEGCGGAACRAALLEAAVRVALGGRPGAAAKAAAFERRAASLWPAGLGAASPDLPNRDPLLQDDPTDLETEGALDPETPRAPLVLWRPADGFAGAARLVAGQLAAGDRDWIAGLATVGARPVTLTLDCETGAGGFRCSGPGAEVSGLLDAGGVPRLRRVALDGAPPVGRLAGDRLPDGRVARLTLDGGRGTLSLRDDLAPLAEALAARAAAGAPALGDGPFRRREALALIADCLGAADG